MIDPKFFLSSYHDPLLFVTDPRGLGKSPRWWQADVLADVRDRLEGGQEHFKLHIRTCHGAGKTCVTSWLFLWWLTTRPQSRAVTTAPTWLAVSNLLWREIHSAYEGSGFYGRLGRMLSTVYEIGSNWVGYGIASDNPARMEGAHSPTAAFRAVDEAKTVPESVVLSTQGMLDSPTTFDMAISTPWGKYGWYYELDASNRADLIRCKVTLADMIDRRIPGSQHAWDEMAHACGGEDTPEFKARAMAEYIEDEDAFGAVVVEALDYCMRKDPATSGMVRVGVDVAYSTDGDESVITVVVGDDCVQQIPLRIRDTVAVSSRAVEIARSWGASEITVDAIGYGAGPVSEIRSWGWANKVREFVASGVADDRERFVNRSTESAWNLIQRVNAREIALPNDPVLRAQFLQVRFEPVAGGRIRLSKAPDGAGSPDRFDSLMMAMAPPSYSGGQGMLEWMRKRKDSRAESRAAA